MDEVKKIVCFRLHGSEYGIPIAQVRESLWVRAITELFLTPTWLTGIINVRGEIIPVIDLATLLNLPPAQVNDNSRMVIAQQAGKTPLEAAFIVDEISTLRDIDLDTLASVPAAQIDDHSAFLLGIVTIDDDRPLGILDVDRLFHSDALRQLQEIHP